jgi:hypothetical protein
MADGFLSRWSRRKVEAEKGLDSTSSVEPVKELAEPVIPIAQEESAPPSATLEDVEKIDRFDPDFSAFMQPNVDPAVQQAALKKMFTDPHFNIMDGLDIYIDDYSKEDPLPPGMLEMMRQSDMLGLFKKVLDEPVLSVAANNAPELESFVVQEKTSSIEDHSIKDPLVLEPQSLEEDNTLVQHQTGGTDQNTIPFNPIAGKAP